METENMKQICANCHYFRRPKTPEEESMIKNALGSFASNGEEICGKGLGRWAFGNKIGCVSRLAHCVFWKPKVVPKHIKRWKKRL